MAAISAFNFSIAIPLHSLRLGPGKTGMGVPVLLLSTDGATPCPVGKYPLTGQHHESVMLWNAATELYNCIPLVHPKNMSTTGSKEVYCKACRVSAMSCNLGGTSFPSFQLVITISKLNKPLKYLEMENSGETGSEST